MLPELRPIPGASRYFIARDGRVFGWSRTAGMDPIAHGTPNGKPLATSPCPRCQGTGIAVEYRMLGDEITAHRVRCTRCKDRTSGFLTPTPTRAVRNA